MGDDRETRDDRRTRDAELTARAVAGDHAAFDQLFRLWFTPVWNLAWGVLRDENLAADVAQDTFLAAWRNLGTLRDPGSFGGWVLRIGRNRALNRLRSERRAAPVERETVAAIEDRAGRRTGGGGGMGGEPDEEVARRERQELVWAAAAVLGERDWLLLDLHLRHGLTPAELAGELGVNANNCHQILHRLRHRLGTVVGHYLLWRHRSRACPQLAAIADAHRHFDQAADTAVARHQARCSTCAAVVADLVRPEQLLAMLPAFGSPPDHLLARAEAGVRAGQDGRAGSGDGGSEAGQDGGGDRAGREGGGGAGTPVSTGATARSTPHGGPDTPPRHRRRRVAVAVAVVAAIALVGPATALGLTRRGEPPGTALAAVAGTIPTRPGSEPSPSPSSPSPSSQDPAPTAAVSGTEPAPATDPPATVPPPDPTAPAGPAASSTPSPTPTPSGTTSRLPRSTTGSTESTTASTTGTTRSSTTSSSSSTRSSTTASSNSTTSTTTSSSRTTATTKGTTSTSRGPVVRKPTPAPDPTDPPPPPPAAPPPSVDARIDAGSAFCRNGSSWTVTWASDGTSSRLEVPGTRTQTFDGDGGSGRATFCAPAGLTLRLTATGDGGTTVLTPVLPT